VAAISSTKTGVWSDTTVWSSGALPTTADDFTILNGHTVTLDVTTAVALTGTVNSGGKLAASTSANSKLTLQRNLRVLSGGTYEALLSALPAVSHELRLYAAGSGAVAGQNHEALWAQAGSTVNLQAYERKRWTKLKTSVASGVSSFVVLDSTNWRVGDRLVFMAETAVSAGGTDEQVVITSITPGTGTEATIGFTNASAGTTLLLAHTAGIPIANFSSNITIGPNTANTGGFVRLDADVAAASVRRLRHVLMDKLGTGSGGSDRSLYIAATAGNAAAGSVTDLTGMAFYKCTYNMGYWDATNWPTTLGAWSLDDIVNWSDVGAGQMLRWTSTPASSQTINRWLQMRGNAAGNINSENTASVYKTVTFNDSHFALMANFYTPFYDVTFNNCDFWSIQYAIYNPGAANGRTVLNNCRVGGVYGSTTNTTGQSPRGGAFGGELEANNTSWNGSAQSSLWTFGIGGEAARGIARSGGGSATSNRIYTDGGAIDSDTTTTRNSPASAKCVNRINGLGAPSDARIVHRFTVAASPNTPSTIKFSGRIDSDYTGTSYPYVRAVLDGTELDRWTHGGVADAWEDGDITFSHSNASTRLVTIEFAGDPVNKTTSNFWFSGMPFDPCIAAARWYGWTFNDTNPVVTADPYLNTTTYPEATALAYTGVTINPTTERVTFSGGTADTFEKLYAYGQAYGASSSYFDSMGYYQMPWTRAGALLSLNTGWTVVEPTITGMTWGGGTIEFTSAGVKDGAFDSCTFDFTVAGTYTMSDCTFAGEVEFVNTSGGSVIVNIPAGVDYVNTGPNITVNEAVVLATASVTGIEPNSRLRVYNETTTTEMANEVVVGTSWSESYTEVVGYTTGDIIRVDVTFCDGTDAKLPFRARAVASSSGWSVLVEQEDDDVYIANAIDGSTVTEFTADYMNVQIDLDDLDGNTTPQRGYAWYVFAITSENGIRNYFGAMTAEDALNYVIENDIVDITLDNVGASAVSITGAALTRRDGSSPIAATSGSIHLWAGRVYAIETGVSGLTGEESDLLAQASNAGNLTIVDGLVAANIEAVRGQELTGTGSEADPWGP
jgi:hypothetical protein